MGWIGVDFDGTLARYEGGKGPDTLGSPIPLMVARVRDWLAEGQEVRIFTARVAGTGQFVQESQQADTQSFAQQQTRLIQDWCERHLGKRLAVTAVKDFACIALYDDRAIQVVYNTGQLVGEDTLR